MAIELNDFVKEILAAPCFGFVATINESNQPVMTRFFGFKHDDPLTTLTVYTFKKDAQHFVNHLSDETKISVATTNAQNYNTAQFKGTLQRYYDVPDEEMNYARESNAKQVEIMEMFGISKEIFANWNFEPSVAISINVEEIFDQTPKVNAGNKIN